MQIIDKNATMPNQSDRMTIPIVLKFVQNEMPPAPSIELNKTVDE